MRRFVLVHGAWHDGRCWDALVDALHARGAGTIVVAHSFGGLILPVVADRRAVAALVYLAAQVPEPGKSFQEQAEAQPDMFASEWGPLAARQVTNDNGSTWWPADAAIEAFYHDCEPAVAETAARNLRSQQWRVANETCPLAALPDLPTQHIACRDDRAVNLIWAVRTARERLGVDAEVMDTSHSPMLSRPDVLAERLLTGP